MEGIECEIILFVVDASLIFQIKRHQDSYYDEQCNFKVYKSGFQLVTCYLMRKRHIVWNLHYLTLHRLCLKL